MDKFWKKLSKIQRLFIVGGLGLVLIIVIFSNAMKSTGRGEFAVLYSELSERDAAEVVKNLKDLKVSYKLRMGGTRILVPVDAVYEARLSLAGKGIPKGGVVGYEIFDKGGIGVTAFTEQVNYKRAIEGELIRTIRSLDEVRDARVHIVTPKERLFSEDQQNPTASVVLNLSNTINEGQIKGIAYLVASSVEGLMSRNVAILDYNGNVLHGSEAVKGGDDFQGAVSTSNRQLELKCETEKYLIKKAQSILEHAVGRGEAIVRVDVELDFTNVVKTVESYDPDGQVIRSRESHSGESAQNSITNYEISKTIEQVVNKTGNIKKLSVSTLINGRYELAEDEQSYEYAPLTSEEISKFTKIVKNAVGYSEERGDKIELTNVPFGAPPIGIEPKRKFPTIPMEAITRMVITFIILGIVFMIVRVLLRELPNLISAKAKTIAPVSGEKRAESVRTEITKAATERPDEAASVIRRIISSEK